MTRDEKQEITLEITQKLCERFAILCDKKLPKNLSRSEYVQIAISTAASMLYRVLAANMAFSNTSQEDVNKAAEDNLRIIFEMLRFELGLTTDYSHSLQ